MTSGVPQGVTLPAERKCNEPRRGAGVGDGYIASRQGRRYGVHLLISYIGGASSDLATG